ncbi:MAG: hypothetical protein Q7K44_04950 [Candidatus Liptonbacteria bacterium]|nr:hypothetical protein [Candidatus Liptonbacteria bacterium]
MSFEDNQQKKKVSSPWKEDEKLGDFEPKKDTSENSSMSTFAKVAIFFIFVAAIFSSAYYYFFMRPAGANVAIEFSVNPDQVFAGNPFILTIPVSNFSDQVLKNVRLSIYLPDKISYLDGSSDQRIVEKNIGDIGPGSVNSNNDFKLLALGDVQTLRHIEAKLAYQLAASTADFESKSGVDISVGQQAVDLSFDLPQGVFGGSSFDMTVKYQNNSGRDFSDDVLLKMDYPSGFQFVKSSIAPTSGNNTQWNLGKLPKGANGSLTLTGSIVGAGQSSFDFHGAVSTGFNGKTFTIAEQTGSVSISASPLSISPSVNGSTDYVARAGDRLIYNFHYKNDSSEVFQNIIIKASLSGEMFDFSSLRTDAAFDPIRNTFAWMTANAPVLAKLSPGEEGTVSIELNLKKDFPIRRISDKNYSLKLQVEINSPTVPSGTAASKTVSVADMETKVAGKIAIGAKAFWRDASSGILNNGPYPPRVNQPTKYTVHWLLTNYSTDVSGIQTSAFLQSGAKWTGVTKSNIDNQPSYDSSTGKVTWDVGNLMATKGVISQQPEAIFQVEVTPAENQLNQLITFLSDTSVTGQDNFTGIQLSDTGQALTTALPDDKTIETSVSRGVQQ